MQKLSSHYFCLDLLWEDYFLPWLYLEILFTDKLLYFVNVDMIADDSDTIFRAFRDPFCYSNTSPSSRSLDLWGSSILVHFRLTHHLRSSDHNRFPPPRIENENSGMAEGKTAYQRLVELEAKIKDSNLIQDRSYMLKKYEKCFIGTYSCIFISTAQILFQWFCFWSSHQDRSWLLGCWKQKKQ